MSVSSILVLVLLSLSSLVSLVSAQCGGAGYDVSALSGKTLTFTNGNAPWTINPCGVVSGVPGITCGAQACRGNTRLSTYSQGAVQWIAADNGVVQLSQTGDLCGTTGPTQSTIRFVCNPSASQAFISDANSQVHCRPHDSSSPLCKAFLPSHCSLPLLSPFSL